MKQVVLINSAPEMVQGFITIWKQKKGYSKDLTLTLGECIELLVATTYTFYKDDSDGRFFNNLLSNEESIIGWDGEELIDILFFECVQIIKKRLAAGGTFNSVIDNDGNGV